MKRSLDPSEIEGSQEKLARRQEPVSCLFCRKKKLKCDRGHPCSNCRARELTCSSSSGSNKTPTGVDKSELGSSSQQIEDLNSRVRKLEDILASKSNFEASVSNSTKCQPLRPKSKSHKSSTDIELVETVTWLETDGFEHEPNLLDGSLATRAKIAEGFGSFIFALTRPFTAPSLNMNAVATLPARSQGEILLDFFFDEILWIYHILHVPTVRSQFDILYTNIENGQQPSYGPLALISTIFALTAYFSSKSSGLFFNHHEAMSRCQSWTSLAQDALSAANCLANPTIETIQSLIFIAQHLMTNMGAIATLRTITATITHTARALKLHQIDSDVNKLQRERAQVDWVELEVKRRIWWHICSTDWILSFMSGSQCGTYAISPKQMTVHYPSNCNDSAINAHGDYTLPLDQPTEMTYFIYRCQGSTIFREIVDAAWDYGCAGVEELPFELVLTFDKNLNSLLSDVEKKYEKLLSSNLAYFDPSATQRGGTTQKLVLFTRQRSMAQFGVYNRLCRLHRPFLVRGAQDPQYAYSRMVCLRSARRVIEIGKNMMNSNERVDSMNVWSINHHMFVSLTILVMDYGFNREEPRARERREEILECFRLLEDREQQREHNIATRGLRKLKEILQHMAKPQRTPETEEPKNPSPSRSFSPSNKPLSYPSADNSISAEGHNIFPPGSAFGQFHSPPQYQWADFDYSSLDKINFDIELDTGQFDILF